MDRSIYSQGGTAHPEAGMQRRSLLKGSAALAGLVGLPSLAFAQSGRADALQRADLKEVVAATTYGKVSGALSPDGVMTFLGIPYGAPTSGANRFAPPQRPAPWSDIRQAGTFGEISPQLPSSSLPEYQAFLGGPTAGVQGEDCLVLNVWTKGVADGRKRPVYVRIHGGGFTTGSGARPLYLGHNTAALEDVVFISMNHRLDCFGYLDLSQSGDSRFAGSGNAGILDLVAMLEWVRDNVENFGGDPDRVMIVGESGGGYKVSTLLGTPAAKGLFSRAVIESGAGLSGRTPADAAETTARFLSHLGLKANQIDALQRMPVYRLLYASALTFNGRYYPDQEVPRGWGPVVDGHVIPRAMFDPVATPISAGVPVIVGYNRDEGTMIRQHDEELYGLTEAMLKTRLEHMVGDRSGRVLSTYKDEYPDATPSELMIQIATDTAFGANSVMLAERKAALNAAPVYMYRFDWPSPALNGKFGATHGLEIPFSAYNISEMAVMTDDRSDAHALGKAMTGAWAAFARDGKPAAPGLPQWPAYAASDRATMIFDAKPRIEHDPSRKAVRELWSEVTPRRLL